jgi:hypothetical protein
MRRHDVGQDAAPAGVTRNGAPGRSPGQTQPATTGRSGPDTVERESGKSRVARRLAHTTKFSACSARRTPSTWGTEKETGRPTPDQTRGQHRVGYTPATAEPRNRAPSEFNSLADR